MSDYTMVVYETYDTENPYFIYYTGDKQGAIDYALGEGAFEVDVYRGDRVKPDSKVVCRILASGEIL